MPKDNTQFDPAVVALMHGLKTAEGGLGNYNAIGDGGTAAGAGQWSNQFNGKVQPLKSGEIPNNFKGEAQTYGLNPNDFSPENQNKVLYTELAAGKAAGLTPEQILSKHNSGDANKYQTAQAKGTGQVGAYDVAGYVQRAMTAAQQYAQSKGQTQSSAVPPPTAPGQPAPQTSSGNINSAIQPPTPPTTSTASNTPSTEPAKETFTGDIAAGNYGGAVIKGGQGILKAVIGPAVSLGTRIAQATAPGVAGLLDATGITHGESAKVAERLKQPLNTAATDLIGSPETPLQGGLKGVEQVGGDALQTGLLAAGPEIGAGKSLLGRLAGNTALGAGLGVGGALSEGGDLKSVGKGAVTGGLVGGAVGGAGELINKIASSLPQRIARSFIPGINQETAQYAVDKGLSTPAKMLTQSNMALGDVGSSIGQAVKGAVQDGAVLPPGEQIFSTIAEQFPDSGLTPETIAANLKKLVPLKANIVDKIVANTATLEDLQKLNSALGSATFKTVFDDPTVKAGKEVGSAIYHEFGDLIKSYLHEDESALYDEYSKEIALNTALKKAVRSGQKAKMFTLRDLVALTSGYGAGSMLGAGPAGAAVGYLGEKALTSPSLNMKVGGLLNKVTKPAVQKAGSLIKSPLVGATTGLLQGR